MTDATAHDVLISVSPSDLAGKWRANLTSEMRAYWRVSGTPRQTEPGRRVWFESTLLEDTIFAWGEILDLTDGRLWFDAAHETHLPALDDAPSRGFTYIEPLLPRLADTEWHTAPTGEIVVTDRGESA